MCKLGIPCEFWHLPFCSPRVSVFRLASRQRRDSVRHQEAALVVILNINNNPKHRQKWNLTIYGTSRVTLTNANWSPIKPVPLNGKCHYIENTTFERVDFISVLLSPTSQSYYHVVILAASYEWMSATDLCQWCIASIYWVQSCDVGVSNYVVISPGYPLICCSIISARCYHNDCVFAYQLNTL